MSVLVVIPTYEEAGNIGRVLTQVRAAAPDVSVLVVDDASPDGTADLARAAAAALGRIDVLDRAQPAGGLGGAYRAGFRWGLERGFDVLVEMDADLSHDPAALPSLLGRLDAGADLVVGSRYRDGGEIVRWAAHRRALSRWGCWYAEKMLRLGLTDATSGYRAYRAALLARIDLGGVRSNGYVFQVEMAYRAARAGGTLAEVPITFAEREAGESKLSWRIIGEAALLVTAWGVRDRLVGRRRGRAVRSAPVS